MSEKNIYILNNIRYVRFQFRQLSVDLLRYVRLDEYYLYRFEKNYYTHPLLQLLFWIKYYRYNF